MFNYRPIDMEIMRTIVSISDTKSFTKSASVLCKTPAAISLQVKKIEEMFGQKFCIRTNHGIDFTPEGEILLKYARKFIKLSHDTYESLGSDNALETIQLGIPQDFGSSFLPRILSAVNRSYADINLNIHLDSNGVLIEKLETGLLDIAIITLESLPKLPNYGEVIYSEPLVWASLENTDLHTIAPLPLAMSSLGCRWRAAALNALEQADRPYSVLYTSSHCEGQKSVVLAGIAIAPLPLSLVTKPLVNIGEQANLPVIGNHNLASCVIDSGKQGIKEVNEIITYTMGMQKSLLEFWEQLPCPPQDPRSIPPCDA